MGMIAREVWGCSYLSNHIAKLWVKVNDGWEELIDDSDICLHPFSKQLS